MFKSRRRRSILQVDISNSSQFRNFVSSSRQVTELRPLILCDVPFGQEQHHHSWAERMKLTRLMHECGTTGLGHLSRIQCSLESLHGSFGSKQILRRGRWLLVAQFAHLNRETKTSRHFASSHIFSLPFLLPLRVSSMSPCFCSVLSCNSKMAFYECAVKGLCAPPGVLVGCCTRMSFTIVSFGLRIFFARRKWHVFLQAELS